MLLHRRGNEPGQFPPPVFSILINRFENVETLWKLARMDKKPSGSHQRRAFGDRLRTTPSAISCTSKSVPALKPKRSRTGLGNTTRPAPSILNVIPF